MYLTEVGRFLKDGKCARFVGWAKTVYIKASSNGYVFMIRDHVKETPFHPSITEIINPYWTIVD